MFLHMLLYNFVIAHMTIWVQLCHVSRQKYTPFVKIPVFTMIAMTVLALTTYIMDEKTAPNLRNAVIIILSTVVLFQWIFIIAAIY